MEPDDADEQRERPASQVWYGFAFLAALLGAFLWQKAEVDYREAVSSARWTEAFSGVEQPEPEKDRGLAYVAIGAAGVLVLAGVISSRSEQPEEEP